MRNIDYYASNRQEWRTWLENKHTTPPGIWLVYYKQQSGLRRNRLWRFVAGMLTVAMCCFSCQNKRYDT